MENETEIPLKQWCHEEAERAGVTPNAIFQRLWRGHYPYLKVRRVNKRVVFVIVPKHRNINEYTSIYKPAANQRA